MEKFLLAYRSTPHSTTGMSPAEMLFNRKLRTKLPHLADLEGWEDDTNIEEKLLRAREGDRVQKQKTKDYADAKRGAKGKDIHPGDQVLVRNERRSSKMMPNYQEEPYEVLERKGSAVIVKGEGGAVKMRNTAHMKKLETLPEYLTYCKEDDSGDLENINLPEVETSVPRDRPEPDKQRFRPWLIASVLLTVLVFTLSSSSLFDSSSFDNM